MKNIATAAFLVSAAAIFHSNSVVAQPAQAGAPSAKATAPAPDLANAPLAGARLADVGLPLGQWPTLLLLSAVWAAVMLVVHGFAGMYRLRARQIG